MTFASVLSIIEFLTAVLCFLRSENTVNGGKHHLSGCAGYRAGIQCQPTGKIPTREPKYVP